MERQAKESPWQPALLEACYSEFCALFRHCCLQYKCQVCMPTGLTTLCLPSLRWERLKKTHICIERTQTLLSFFKWYSSTDDIASYCIRLSRGDTMYMRRYVQIICKFYATFPKGPNIWRFCCRWDSGYTYSLVDTDGGQRLVLDPSLFAMV